MNTLVVIIVVSLINCAAIWLSHYFGRSGHNAAEKEDIKAITYLSESGKNLATKEDIEDITKKIEIIKNEISFENQRKHQFIEDRVNRLLKVLKYAEDVRTLQNQLGFLLYDETNLCNLTEVIKEANKVVADLAHECRMLAVITDDDDLTRAAYNLLQESQIYCSNFCRLGSAHLTRLHSLQAKLELVKTLGDETISQDFSLLRKEIEKNKQEYCDVIEPYRKNQYDATVNYISVLKRLYKKDFHLRFEYKS